MLPAGASDDVVRFLRDEIDSVRELEMLVALRAAGPVATTAGALASALRSGDEWTGEQLARMAAKGFVSATTEAGHVVYRYAPDRPALAAVIDDVARLFETRRTHVIGLIFSGSEPSESGRLES